jgi:membrane-associated phospholipid phosphatase
VALAVTVTDLGSPVAMIALAALGFGWLSVTTRSLAPILVATAGVVGIVILDVGMKRFVGRARPPLRFHEVTAPGFSFPSGHAIISAFVLLLCASAVAARLHGSGRRRALWATTILFIGAVGCSRVYLGVHDPSDVLAGWSLACTWFPVLLLLVRRWVGPAVPQDALTR